MQPTSDHELDIVLEPLSRPELGELRVEGSLFAVGRSEPPFAACGDDVLAMLSRRHARIFCENGAVYLADLQSRNGTTLNRSRIDQAPRRLRDGDEIGFGGVLSYRVKIVPRAASRRHKAPSFSLTLSPAAGDAQLQAIVITRFPFLVGKNDPAFSRYHNDHTRQLSFLSRRHAHIFRKDGGVWIEDLGSLNGTFVDGLRLQEHAVPLEDGVLLAFGGDHFTYRVGIDREASSEPGSAGARTPAHKDERTEKKTAARSPVATDKTTFVAAPTSFLQIFCIDDDEPDPNVQPQGVPAPAAPASQPARRRARGRSAVLWSELLGIFAGTEDGGAKRSWWKGATVVAVLAALAVALYLRGAPERELQEALGRGDHVQAAALAHRALEQRPDDTEVRAIATEAALKAHVPAWLARLQARDFDGANAVLAGMSTLAARNPDLRALLGELQWLGDLQRLVSDRGGPEAPLRIYVDEDRIEALIRRWNDNTGEHQRSLARIASHVPQFGAPYAEALTHLRRLQSDATVVLAASARLKAAIVDELRRDDLRALQDLLKDAAAKYPRLGGLDAMNQDLARFIDIRNEARGRKSGRLFALLHEVRFTTPPFQDAYRELSASRLLPAAPLVAQYAAATQAWKSGRTDDALSALQKLAAGSTWADAIVKEVARRQAVVAQFAQLQVSRAASGYAEQLLAFRASLDPDQDQFFARATQAELEQQKDKVLVRAQEAMNRARALWRDYRNSGAIEAGQRIETAISASFRSRAGLLSEADRLARQAMQIHAQFATAAPAPWSTVGDEIRAEAQQQRDALRELRNVLEPQLLNSKLALLGEPNA